MAYTRLATARHVLFVGRKLRIIVKMTLYFYYTVSPKIYLYIESTEFLIVALIMPDIPCFGCFLLATPFAIRLLFTFAAIRAPVMFSEQRIFRSLRPNFALSSSPLMSVIRLYIPPQPRLRKEQSFALHFNPNHLICDSLPENSIPETNNIVLACHQSFTYGAAR